MSELADEKYIRLTTFTKDGRPKPAPVWIADLGDGTFGFTTEEDSWKVKRIRNTPAVELAASDARGNVADDAVTISAIAEIRSGAGAEPVAAAIKAKYGWQVTLIKTIGVFRHLFRSTPESVAVVLTLED